MQCEISKSRNHERKVAMSSRIIRSSARSLTLVAAALLIHIGSAVAADSAQEQARQVLLGVTTVVSADGRTARAVGPDGDAQEQARRSLLGVTAQTPGRPQPGTFTVSENRFHGDAQALARQVLLGRRGGLGE
jgi:hypothetical protein